VIYTIAGFKGKNFFIKPTPLFLSVKTLLLLMQQNKKIRLSIKKKELMELP